MFFPATSFRSSEEFSVVAAVAWITASEWRVVNLLPYPALVRAVDDHFSSCSLPENTAITEEVEGMWKERTNPSAIIDGTFYSYPV
jgi:hypothetical protein